MKQHNGMRPLDVAVLLKIIALADGWLNKDIAVALSISPSEISESLNRSRIAGLLDPAKKKVFRNALLEFIRYGLPYVFPVEPGPVVRGVPTAHSAPILAGYFLSEEAYVWPFQEGKVRGQAITPLYPKAVQAALADDTLYEMLALVDAIRAGRTREKQKALEVLKSLFDRQHA